MVDARDRLGATSGDLLPFHPLLIHHHTIARLPRHVNSGN